MAHPLPQGQAFPWHIHKIIVFEQPYLMELDHQRLPRAAEMNCVA